MAYYIRIRYWSSDVCSSDLHIRNHHRYYGCSQSVGLVIYGSDTILLLAVRNLHSRYDFLWSFGGIFHAPASRYMMRNNGLILFALARKRDGAGRRVYVRVDLGGRRIIKQQKSKISKS